jgi:predicted dienelactone hydrolase
VAAGLSKIKIPVSVVIGQADKVAPLATNAQRYASLIKGAKLDGSSGRNRTLHIFG